MKLNAKLCTKYFICVQLCLYKYVPCWQIPYHVKHYHPLKKRFENRSEDDRNGTVSFEVLQQISWHFYVFLLQTIKMFLFFYSVFLSVAEIWSPFRRGSQRCTHGLCWWRRVDGVLRGILHPSLSHGNSGAAAGNQHLHALISAERWYGWCWYVGRTPRSCAEADLCIHRSQV